MRRRRIARARPRAIRNRFFPSVTREIRSIHHEIIHLLFAPWKDLEDDDRMDLVRVARVDDDEWDG